MPGGETGQMSIYNGLVAAAEVYGTEDNIVLIHDGVRPLIDDKTISANISCVKKHGCAVTCASAKETFIITDDTNEVKKVADRKQSKMAKAPQSFYLKEILEMQNKAISEGNIDMIDSCTLMNYYGKKLYIVECGYENIKITTPDDFYMFRALYDARENQQLN